MFDIDHWLFGLAQRFLPFLSLEKFDDGKSALLHTTEGLAWAGFALPPHSVPVREIKIFF